MPSKDKNGKPLSGAALRKIREAKRKLVLEGTEKPREAPQFPPPPDDVGHLISWAAMMLGLLLAEAYKDTKLIGAERYRTIGQLTAQLGMIRDKALDQDRITRLAKKAGLIADDTNSELKPTNGLTRPQTARRLRKPGDEPIR